MRAALTLGEIGVFVDLSGMQGIIQTISNLFEHPDDQVRQASAIALGGISIGNTEYFIPQVFDLINKSQQQQKYMYFNTIKEIIVNKPGCLKNYLADLMPLYFSQASSDNEAIRNIVAESIGKLFNTYPAEITPSLTQAFNTDDLAMQITCTKSFKYSAHSGAQVAHFQPFILILLQKIDATDLSLKEYALDSIGQIAYNPNLCTLLYPYIDSIVGQALQETPVKKDLVKTIDLGPFKHTVDHGVPIRKSAFNLLQNMMNRFPVKQTEDRKSVV